MTFFSQMSNIDRPELSVLVTEECRLGANGFIGQEVYCSIAVWLLEKHPFKCPSVITFCTNACLHNGHGTSCH